MERSKGQNLILRMRAFGISKKFPLAVICAQFFAIPASAIEAAAKVIDVKLGTVQYSKTDGATPLTGSARAQGLELCLFYKLDRCVFGGYREAIDPTSKRDYYLAAYSGWRYFPLGIGHPVDTVLNGATISYDSHIRPFIQTSLALGRALYNPVLGGAEEQAADILGLNLGFGMAWYPIGRWAVNFEVSYEQYQSRGGTANSLSLSGNNLFLLLGSGYLF